MKAKGKRNHRYARDEARRIAEQLRNKATSREVRQAAETFLKQN